MANPLAKQVLGLYDLPRNASLRLISFSENEVYLVEAPSGARWAMRIHRPGYQSARSLASEIAWLCALRQDGVVATPLPIAGLNGEWVQSALHPSTAERCTVVLFAWEEGCPPSIEQASAETEACFRNLGAIIARMHAHSLEWQRPEWFDRFTWNFETTLGGAPRWGSWRNGLGMDSVRLEQVARTTEVIRQRLAVYGSHPDRFGLAHCDLRVANLLVHAGEVKVIDFDDCGFGWYMFDIATTVSFYEHLAHAPTLIEILLEGYRTVRGLSQADEEEIPTFIMLRRILLMAWVGSHATTDLARSLGMRFTEQTVGLCSAYLKRFA